MSSPVNCVISRTCWSVLLTDWDSAVFIDSRQKSMFLGPCLTSISAIKPTLSMSPLGDDRVAGERADLYLST